MVSHHIQPEPLLILSLLRRRTRCECGEQAAPVWENGQLVGFICPCCGPMTHDMIVQMRETECDADH